MVLALKDEPEEWPAEGGFVGRERFETPPTSPLPKPKPRKRKLTVQVGDETRGELLEVGA